MGPKLSKIVGITQGSADAPATDKSDGKLTKTSGLNNIKKDKSGEEVVENFLSYSLRNLPPDCALKVIATSFTGRAIFADYLASEKGQLANIPSIFANLEESLDWLYTWINVTENKDNCTDHADHCHFEFRLEVYDFLPEFLTSSFYEAWRREETIQIQNLYRKISYDNSKKNRQNRKRSLSRTRLTLSKRALCSVIPVISTELPESEDKGRKACFSLETSPASSWNSTSTSSDFSADHIPHSEILDAVNEIELKKIFNKETWLFHLLCSMENMPISFTLASASGDTGCFPIIYANKQFETLTGYSRTEAIGRSSSFLQMSGMMDNFWEPRAVQEMEVALCEGQMFSTIISHFRKNGDLYRSFVYLKPVFDTSDKYIYMVSVQFDVTEPRDLSRAVELSEELLTDIPRQIGSSAISQEGDLVA
mmetsp:Transcript_18324/g.18404  ORF Transcript_18324/g.18404 Transcript_18324/m.18404 type:complete len:423 (+) Transcript_18324:29-1297(+)|eukprot:CAMPEP_0182418526 /NCGR_PEP_ID=MMETSP1167-20130531/2935_1 /TAXON_ID=2988 /ORGANISM="Mallomonas Sp, Strain CCMP3275" /LENGTH=422 /DNA_ID=CAMNT_0024592773 /DNA_START=29 /DNA_END=1297 /DNA_ORIENTATION=+